MSSRKIVVVGGAAAGPKTAAKARRMDQHAEITIIQKESDFSMASCGYPYYVGGFFDDRAQLISSPTGVIRDSKFFLGAKGIQAMALTEALSIDRENRKVKCRSIGSDATFDVEYDKLVLATGADAVRPPIPGIDLDGVTALKSLADADYLRQVRDEKKVRRAVVVGGGLIGVETCEALELAGIEITIIEMQPQLLMFLDWEMAKLLENYIKTRAANVITGNRVVEFVGENGKLTGVRLDNGGEIPCELAVVAIGVRPNVGLARECGIEIGSTGGISVNEYLQTTDPNVFAVGDCIEIPHLLTGKQVLAPLGDLANLQGRVAGQNVINGNSVTYPGAIQTGICKVFDWTAGSTGLSEAQARRAGFENTVSVICPGVDKPFFMGGELIVLKMLADRDTGRILGVQGVGPGDVSKRIAVAAIAVQAGFTVGDLLNSDLPYAPPFSPAVDPIITTAHVLENKMLGRMPSLSPVEVKKRLDDGSGPFMLDVRSPVEYETERLGIGEHLIPLGQLRQRLNELPEDKTAEIVCYCKISLRGYEAAGYLAAKGYENAKVMEGGIAAWPYPREK